MDMGSRSGLMALSTRANGTRTRHMERGPSGMQMVTAMTVSLRMTSQMVMVSTHALMGPFMRESGWTTFSTVKARRSGQMAQIM